MKGHVLRRIVPLIGLLPASGCLLNLQQNIENVLAPSALGNALQAPYSAVVALAQFMASYFFG